MSEMVERLIQSELQRRRRSGKMEDSDGAEIGTTQVSSDVFILLHTQAII